MTKQLTPRNLDIKITKITNKTVHYELTANGACEQWRIPDNSTFHKSTLTVDDRYRVATKVIRCRQWNQKAQDYIYADTYDWVAATPVPPKAKLVARSFKQRQASEAFAAIPLGDNHNLFT